MPAFRLFAVIVVFLTFLHFIGPTLMQSLRQSHDLMKILFFIVLVVIVEFGIWATVTGPSKLIRRLRENPGEAFQDIKGPFLKLSIIQLLLLMFLLSIFLKG